MSKILISFVGTGQLNKTNPTSDREYRTAPYSFDQGNTIINTSFVAQALAEHYNVDRMILIGTVKSMWEEVYKVYSKDKFDEQYYFDLIDFTSEANHKSELYIPNKGQLEEALGGGSQIVLIKYGLNKSEIDENASTILALEQLIHNGDEIIVDITHSFRSLPLIIMNLIIFLKNVSNKQINISHICYGNIEICHELGFAPIIELNDVLDINEWITGAYAFSQFGNGYKIAELLYKEDHSAYQLINNFSNEMNLNHLDGVKKQSILLSSIKNKHFSPIPQSIIPQSIESFIKGFPSDCNDAVFLLNVSEWHFIHKNYSSAYISLLEAILTHVCEVLSIPHITAEDMEYAKEILGKNGPLFKKEEKQKTQFQRAISGYNTLSESYFRINKIRNGLAHQARITIHERDSYTGKMKECTVNAENMIKILGEEIKKLKGIIK